MLPSATGLLKLDDLRSRASMRLAGGGSTNRNPTSRTTDALAVLHALASSQATAGDALALLHELQVHQVEVDLQAEELRDARNELEAALRRQTAHYDALPVACFTVDRELVVSELNLASACLLGLGRDDACGFPLGTLLSAASALALQQLLRNMAPGAGSAAAVLQWVPRQGPPRNMRADIGPDPAGAGCLLVLTEITDLAA